MLFWSPPEVGKGENNNFVQMALHLHLEVEKTLGKWHSRWIIKTCCAHFIMDGGKYTTVYVI